MTYPNRLFARIALALAFISVFHSGANEFLVTNTDDAGLGSLRQAILNANAPQRAVQSSLSINTFNTFILARHSPG